jgi:ABC-type tungstate transport system substrate-binding protein
MKLIDNARQCYKFAVMWVQGFGATAMTVWVTLTDEQRQAVLSLFGITPDRIVALVALSLFIAGMVARVTKQEALHKPEDDQ